jgi:hypothetical protein
MRAHGLGVALAWRLVKAARREREQNRSQDMRLVILAAALAMVTACASATDVAEGPAPAGRDCFRSDDVSGFNIMDDDTLRIRVLANRNYSVSANQIGRDLRFEQGVTLRSRTGWICTGDTPDLDVFGHGIVPRRYLVRSVERIVEEPEAETSEAPAAQGS